MGPISSFLTPINVPHPLAAPIRHGDPRLPLFRGCRHLPRPHAPGPAPTLIFNRALRTLRSAARCPADNRPTGKSGSR